MILTFSLTEVEHAYVMTLVQDDLTRHRCRKSPNHLQLAALERISAKLQSAKPQSVELPVIPSFDDSYPLP
jgi:hypothetical protein